MHISPNRIRLTGWIALPVALLASGAVIGTASYSAFSATTDNAANSWRTGTVTLSDDDEGTALFDADGLVPGTTGSNVITVTSTSSVATSVHLYTEESTDDDVARYIDMTIERGTLADADDPSSFTPTKTVSTGTLAELEAKTSFGAGVDDWAPAKGTDSAAYRFTYTANQAMPNTAQDSATGTTFVWEAQSD